MGKHDVRTLAPLTSVTGVKRAQVLAAALAATLALAACGGDDDDSGASSTPAPQSTAPSAVVTSTTTTTTAAPTTPAPTMPELVTEGATVVVANASRVNGAAGRMTDRLRAVGFTMGEATNSSEGPLDTTKVYYNASVPEAEAVARSVVAALGGDPITLEPLPTPAPLQDPEAIGEATVLVALGGDTADKTLEELQGIATTTSTADTTDSTDSTETGSESSAPSTAG